MKHIVFIIAALLFLLAASCGHQKPYHELNAKDYMWHKNTIYIKVHWNLLRPDANTVIADGFVEPFSRGDGVHTVRLELVGLDEDGKEVSKAEGKPADNYIVSPYETSPFRIDLKRTGAEETFTIRGSYYFYGAGRKPDFSSSSLDYILLESDEPL